MNITRKTSYSLRALYEIVVSGHGRPVNRKLIAENQNISTHFLENLLKNLSDAGITRSIRGPGGGFVLNKSASKITVWDIYTAVENRRHFYEKCAFINKKQCSIYKRCQIKYVWLKINKSLKKSMTGITLEDICQNQFFGEKKNE
jgi:Rrf2 family iron-sulfur cluster assembly transcriptional regulator